MLSRRWWVSLPNWRMNRNCQGAYAAPLASANALSVFIANHFANCIASRSYGVRL